MKKKILFGISIFILIAIGIFFVLFEKQPIRVGFISALTGTSADLGFSSRNAFQMAVDEINKSGGINGRKVEITIHDDQGNPDIALTVFQSLIEDDYKLIVGQVTSTSAAKTIPYINTQDALFITPLVSHNGYMGEDDHFIAVIPSASTQGETISNLIKSRKSSARIAIVYASANLVYTKSVADGVINEIENFPEYEFKEFSMEDNSEIPQIVKDVANYQPTDIVVAVNVSDLVLITNQIRKELGSVTIYSSMWGMAPEVISGYGEQMSDVYGVYAIDPNSTAPQFLTFLQDYESIYHISANFAAIYTYDAAMLLFEAIEQTNSDDPKIIKQYIVSQGSFNGINSDYRINDKGDAIRKMYIIHAKDGTTINE